MCSTLGALIQKHTNRKFRLSGFRLRVPLLEWVLDPGLFAKPTARCEPWAIKELHMEEIDMNIDDIDEALEPVKKKEKAKRLVMMTPSPRKYGSILIAKMAKIQKRFDTAGPLKKERLLRQAVSLQNQIEKERKYD